MRTILILSLLALAGCGADGEPLPPAKSSSQPGVTVSGSARLGVGFN